MSDNITIEELAVILYYIEKHKLIFSKYSLNEEVESFKTLLNEYRTTFNYVDDRLNLNINKAKTYISNIDDDNEFKLVFTKDILFDAPLVYANSKSVLVIYYTSNSNKSLRGQEDSLPLIKKYFNEINNSVKNLYFLEIRKSLLTKEFGG